MYTMYKLQNASSKNKTHRTETGPIIKRLNTQDENTLTLIRAAGSVYYY